MSRSHMWQHFEEAMDYDLIDRLNGVAKEKYELRQATTFNVEDFSAEDLEIMLKARSSKVAWMDDDVELRNILWGYTTMANASAFGLDVTPMTSIQYTQYSAEENGHYDWHNDVDWAEDRAFSRKLSIIAQLSDPSEYEGGDFEFSEVENPPVDFKRKGSILVFPSYLTHRITPVTEGVRASVVAWFEGPKWR